MVRSLRLVVAVAAVGLVAPLAASIGAQPTQPAAPAPTGPKLGSEAPDFTIPVSTKDGVRAKPLHLADLRGQTVVLAFFPRARTQGCTVQMKTYRDQYAGLFKSGTKIVLVGISTDADTTLANWAREEGFPFLMGSDMDGKVGTMYATYNAANKSEARNLVVIAPDGTIGWEQRPVRVMAQETYSDLGAAVEKVSKGAGGAR